jgi:hypothetical protein
MINRVSGDKQDERPIKRSIIENCLSMARIYLTQTIIGVLLVKFDLERLFLPTYGHYLTGALAVIR